jgi:SNF2 family DNA or RNA helicase
MEDSRRSDTPNPPPSGQSRLTDPPPFPIPFIASSSGSNHPSGLSTPTIAPSPFPSPAFTGFQHQIRSLPPAFMAALLGRSTPRPPPPPHQIGFLRPPPHQIGFLLPPPPPPPSKSKRSTAHDEKSKAQFSSSDEAESSESESEEEDFYQEPAPITGPVERRKGCRENRKTVNRTQEESYFDEEEEIGEINSEETDGERLEHIFARRKVNRTFEYLVRFADTPPGMSQWISQQQLERIENGSSHLKRFVSTPIEMKKCKAKNIVAHRRESDNSEAEFLFRVSIEGSVLFFWDKSDCPDEYFERRTRVNICDPSLTIDELPTITIETIVSKKGERLRDYQIEGISWLLECWRNFHGSILADEMGLGKTIELLGFLSFLNANTAWHGPFLIIVRTNTFEQWCDEIEMWTDLSYVPYHSGPAQRGIIRHYQFPFLDDLGNGIANTYGFNILVVSYDILLKDIEILHDIKWEIMILDEGHRIKNSCGKKNNAIRNLSAKHRIILTGTPIQNTLTELWTLLRFVSPNDFEHTPEFIETEMEELTEEMIETIQIAIRPHILRRSITEVEQSIAPKQERVFFVGLTQIQRDLIRLTKMHKLWRLKGIQTSEDEIDPSNESHLIFKICSHPFLLPEADTFYTKQLCGNGRFRDRADLLMAVSSKFQWLDNVLRFLHRDKHRVLIFSQRVELLKLLDEFVGLRGYTKELLLGSMSDRDKANAINHYSKSNLFIFLISSRAGSEGLNLTAADTAIIFDPDWNPQNDLQAQGRCHRIGQTQKVDVLRLSTFQTYEHEIFVRAQRKLRLWLTLFGLHDCSTKSEPSRFELNVPPEITPQLDLHLSLDDVLERTSTIVQDFSIGTLPILEIPLETPNDFSNGQSDEDFLGSFPVHVETGKRRTKRSRSREFEIDREVGVIIFNRMELKGYGEWNSISEELEDHPEDQIHRFCMIVAVLSLRALAPEDVIYFQILTSRLMHEDFFEFRYTDFFCNNKHFWLEIFPEGHELNRDFEAVKKIRSEILNDPFRYLSILEMRLVYHYWVTFHNKDDFAWHKIAPTYTANDHELLAAITTGESFDPFDLRVQAIIQRMRSDIIKAGRNEEIAYQTEWWTKVEFEVVVGILKNVPFNITDFHERTALLGKSKAEVIGLAEMLIEKVDGRNGFTVPKEFHCIAKAPNGIQKMKGFSRWTHLSPRESSEIAERINLIESVRRKESEIAGSEKTKKWGDFETKQFLGLLLEFGVEQQHDLLLDERFNFKKFLSKSDRAFLCGDRERRKLMKSSLPDFLFTEADLAEFVQPPSEPTVIIHLPSPRSSPRRH